MKPLKTTIAALCCALAAIGAVQAAAPDYDAVLRASLGGSAALTADSLSRDAALVDILADNVPEGPEVEFEHMWPQGGGHVKWSAGVSQSFDWPGAYGARSAQARAQQSYISAANAGAALDKALTLKQLIIDIVNLRQRLEVYEQVGSNLERLQQLIENSYKLENATVLDLRKARLAVLDNRRVIAQARADLDNLCAAYSAQTAYVPDAADWTVYPAQQLRRPDEDALEQTADIRALRAAGDVARARIGVLRAEAMPRFRVGYRHAYEEATHFNGFAVAVTLPSWNTSRRRQAAELESAANTFTVNARLIELRAALDADYRAAAALGRDMQAYDELTGDNSYLQLLGKAYDGGELSVIDYLNELRLFTENRLGYLDLAYRYNLALARLNSRRSVYFN